MQPLNTERHGGRSAVFYVMIPHLCGVIIAGVRNIAALKACHPVLVRIYTRLAGAYNLFSVKASSTTSEK